MMVFPDFFKLVNIVQKLEFMNKYHVYKILQVLLTQSIVFP